MNQPTLQRPAQAVSRFRVSRTNARDSIQVKVKTTSTLLCKCGTKGCTENEEYKLMEIESMRPPPRVRLAIQTRSKSLITQRQALMWRFVLSICCAYLNFWPSFCTSCKSSWFYCLSFLMETSLSQSTLFWSHSKTAPSIVTWIENVPYLRSNTIFFTTGRAAGFIYSPCPPSSPQK